MKVNRLYLGMGIALGVAAGIAAAYFSSKDRRTRFVEDLRSTADRTRDSLLDGYYEARDRYYDYRNRLKDEVEEFNEELDEENFEDLITDITPEEN